MDGWVDEWLGGWIGGQMDGQKNGWMDRRMDEWMRLLARGDYIELVTVCEAVGQLVSTQMNTFMGAC